MKVRPVIRERARSLRRDLTDAERILWSRLKGRQRDGWHFRCQHPIEFYIVDFACVKAKLIVEVDGDTHSTVREIEYDVARDGFLKSRGWHIVRIWNNDVYDNLNGVLDTIDEALRYAHMSRNTDRD